MIKSVIQNGLNGSAYFWLIAVAVAGVVISLWYYFGVIRVIYWSEQAPDVLPIEMSRPIRVSLYGCIAGMLFLGLYPGPLVNWASRAVKVLKF